LQKKSKIGYINKLFVPSWLQEYFPNRIEITDVRCERLQEISDEDCLKEGIIETYPDMLSEFPFTTIHYFWDIDYGTHIDARQAYAALFDSINGRGAWESNPYVWVYEFKLINNK